MPHTVEELRQVHTEERNITSLAVGSPLGLVMFEAASKITKPAMVLQLGKWRLHMPGLQTENQQGKKGTGCCAAMHADLARLVPQTGGC